MTIGQRIKRARVDAGLTQAELSEASGVSQQMISRLESGVAKSTTDIVALADALGVTAEFLATGRGIRQDRPAPISPRARRMGQKFAALSPKRQDLVLRLIDELT